MPEAAAKTEKPEAPAAEAKAKPAAGGGGGKLVPALLAFNSLLMVALLALTVLRGGLPGHGAKHAAEADQGEAKAEAKEEGHGGGEGHGSKAEAKAAEPDEKEAKGAKGPGPTLKLPDFVVHLRDPDADRYARLTFEVELRDEKGKEELTARMPVVRDAFLLYLSDRKAEDLRGADAMVQLKSALTSKLAEAVPGLKARALYVTELVVQ